LVVSVLVVAAASGGCGPDIQPPLLVFGTTTSTVHLTREKPVAIAEVVVAAGDSRAATAPVALHADLGPIRVAAQSGESALQFADSYSNGFTLGALDQSGSAFRGRAVVWATDASMLPRDVALTIEVTLATFGGANRPTPDSTQVSADWTTTEPPSVVSRTVSGEMALAAKETASATLDIAFAPDHVADPSSVVTTWWAEAGFVTADKSVPSTADLRVTPGYSATLYEPSLREIFKPDTITCTPGLDCSLRYGMDFRGNEGRGTLRWQVIVEIVDFSGPAPTARRVDVTVKGIPASEGALSP
jgi:hypothetical protein